MTKDELYYWLLNLQNIGLKKVELLLRTFGSVEAVYEASAEEFEVFRRECCPVTLRFSTQDIHTLCTNRNPEIIKERYAKLRKSGIYFVSKEDERYPEQLRNIYDAPHALFVKGRLPQKEEKLLAIVGARECTPYGREMAKYFAGALAKEGIGIISGLARGIDTHAHEGALSSGGITYGILGCGIDICYPKENFNLYMELQKQGGILSEYAPGTSPLAGNFPMRNRIISGLCSAILVIEAKEKSGSLITVDYGLEHGKDIYALPGKPTDLLSGGCNNLIKMGAKLVTTPKDILEDIFPNYKQRIHDFKKNNKILELKEKIVYASLCLEPKHIEEIALLTGMTIDVLVEQLLALELKGYIKQIMRNYYIVIE
jgi:DNA processing protein